MVETDWTRIIQGSKKTHQNRYMFYKYLYLYKTGYIGWLLHADEAKEVVQSRHFGQKRS